jgi:membrane protein YdbS with pleckstrin-like domain
MDAVSRLRDVYFLQNLLPEEFEALAEMMDLRPFVAGDRILTQGEPTTNFYIVDSGHVNLRYTDRSGLEKPISSKGPGEFFGVKMFTTQEPSEYTFEAVGKAEMWVVERQDWEALLDKFPHVLEHMPELQAEYKRLTRGLEWLAPGEVVQVFMRQHWWGLFLMIRLPAFVALVFTIAYAVSFAFDVPQNYVWVTPLYGILMGLCLLWGLYEAADWYNDTYVVTNKRVVRYNKVLFFSDSRDEIPIEKIQSQSISRGGPISVLLNIADLRITSAASDTQGVTFNAVGDVQRMQRAISAEQIHIAERKSAAERERTRMMIAGEIRHYVLEQNAQPGQAPPPPPAAAAPAAAPKGKTKKATPKSGWGSWWKSLYGTEMREGRTVTWRKHHYVLLRQIFWGLVMFFLLCACASLALFGGVPPQLTLNGVYASVAVLLIPTLIFVAWQWADWRNDLYRLSENDIVDIESLPFGLRYREQRAELSKIQDIKTSRPRFVNTLLNFGNVEVRVAGNSEPFTFDSVGHPHFVADEITERIEMMKVRATDRTARESTRQIVDAIVAYHRLLMTERYQNAPAPNPPQPAGLADVTTAASTLPGETSAPPSLPRPTDGRDGEFPPEL